MSLLFFISMVLLFVYVIVYVFDPILSKKKEFDDFYSHVEPHVTPGQSWSTLTLAPTLTFTLTLTLGTHARAHTTYTHAIDVDVVARLLYTCTCMLYLGLGS